MGCDDARVLDGLAPRRPSVWSTERRIVDRHRRGRAGLRSSHFSFLLGLAGDPPLWLQVSAVLVSVIPGVVFRWLFWRAGLDAAILAHSFAHVTAIVIGTVAGIACPVNVGILEMRNFSS